MYTSKILPLLFIIFLTGCKPGKDNPGSAEPKPAAHTQRFYSAAVNDSFTLFTSLPKEYAMDQSKKYPVVFLLDANLYFNMMATILHSYAEVGLAPQVILVGIGYRDFMMMDSLRNRDDTYPLALPEYEMPVSGGADKFLSFIDEELIPLIDSQYRTDTTARTLAGHSLAGYFTSYALYRHLSGHKTGISKYIAASPSFHYNNYYLIDQLKAVPHNQYRKIHTYITYGGLEENDGDTTMRAQQMVLKELEEIFTSRITYKADVYSNLDHMDTQLPTFIKGLQFVLDQK